MIYDSIYRVAGSRAVTQGEICPQLSARGPHPSSVTATAPGPLLVSGPNSHPQNIPTKEGDPITLQLGLDSWPCIPERLPVQVLEA